MKAYAAVIGVRFRMLLQYRMAAVAGLGTQVFWGLIRMMFFTAFYRSTTARQPMSLADVITYVWLGQAMLGMLPWIIDREMRAMIRSGTVAYELARPLDLYTFWFCRDIARRTAPTLLRGGTDVHYRRTVFRPSASAVMGCRRRVGPDNPRGAASRHGDRKSAQRLHALDGLGAGEFPR